MPGLLQLAQELTLCLSARVTPLVLGERGIGKSAIVHALAQSTESAFAALREHLWGSGAPVGYINLRGSLHEAADFTGLPFLDESNGRKITNFAPPAILPQVEMHGNQGLLFLDEIFRAQHDVQQAIFQLIEHQRDESGGYYHRCGRYCLPSGWDVVAASNPPGNVSYTQNAFLDTAFLDRFCILDFTPDEEYLAEWASYIRNETDVSAKEKARVIAYTANHSLDSMFLGRMAQAEDVDTKNYAWATGCLSITPSPRSWEEAARVNTMAESLSIFMSSAHKRVLGGLIGQALVDDYITTKPMPPVFELLELPFNKLSRLLRKLDRNGVRELVWNCTGIARQLTRLDHREAMLNILEILYGACLISKNIDLLAGLARELTVLGIREFEMVDTYSVTALRDVENLKALLDVLDPDKSCQNSWLRLLADRPRLYKALSEMFYDPKRKELEVVYEAD